MKSIGTKILLAGAIAVCALAQTTDFNTGQAARLVIGQKNFTIGDYGATNQLIGSPAGLAMADGVLWVVDSNRLGSTPNNNRVLRFTDTTTYPGPTEPQICLEALAARVAVPRVWCWDSRISSRRAET